MFIKLFYAIFGISFTLLIIYSVLVYVIHKDDKKRKELYGNKYKEESFRRHISNDCLVTRQDIQEYDLPKFIRFKGVDINTGECQFIEGIEIGDRAIVYGHLVRVVSVMKLEFCKNNNITENGYQPLFDELNSFSRNFLNCSSILELTVNGETLFVYCNSGLI